MCHRKTERKQRQTEIVTERKRQIVCHRKTERKRIDREE